MISYRQADLIDKVKKREMKVNDRVRVRADMLEKLGSNAPHYKGNAGRVKELFYSGYYYSAVVKWENKINTTDNESTLGVKFLEFA